MLKAGAILIGPYPPGSDKQRRFLILSDEIAEPNPQVAWVYVSTSMNDTTVVLKKGCHPAIAQDCCVIYEEAEVVRVSAVHAALGINALSQFASVLPISLLEKVQEGVFDSEETPIRVVNFCTERI